MVFSQSHEGAVCGRSPLHLPQAGDCVGERHPDQQAHQAFGCHSSYAGLLLIEETLLSASGSLGFPPSPKKGRLTMQ